jgi:hypothetical protein
MKHIKGPLMIDVRQEGGTPISVLLSDVFHIDGKWVAVETGWDDHMRSKNVLHILNGEVKGDIEKEGMKIGDEYTIRRTTEDDDIALSWVAWTGSEHDAVNLLSIVQNDVNLANGKQ